MASGGLASSVLRLSHHCVLWVSAGPGLQVLDFGFQSDDPQLSKRKLSSVTQKLLHPTPGLQALVLNWELPVLGGSEQREALQAGAWLELVAAPPIRMPDLEEQQKLPGLDYSRLEGSRQSTNLGPCLWP